MPEFVAGPPDIRVSNDALDLFRARMLAVPLLSREQEIELAREIETNRQDLLRCLNACPYAREILATGEHETSTAQHEIHDWAPGAIEAACNAFVTHSGNAQEHEQASERLGEMSASRRRLHAATRRMFEANMRLVYCIARRYENRGIDLPDLVQEGCLGLMCAIEKFEHRRGFKFSTYATWWIRQGVARAVADRSRTIRLPIHVGDEFARVRRARGRIRLQEEHEPTIEELAAASGFASDKVRSLLALPVEPASLDILLPDGETELIELIPDDAPTQMEALSHARMCEFANALVDSMSPVEAKILRLRFGIGDGEPHTYEEIAQSTGISREQVRRIEKRALAALRASDRARLSRWRTLTRMHSLRGVRA